MSSISNFIVAISLLVSPVAVQAADLGVGSAQCVLSTSSTLISEPNDAALTQNIVQLMNEAVGVADDARWINSRQPAFTWASEAKVACGKAYGYLKASYRDEDTINKCECFHSRMVQYMY